MFREFREGIDSFSQSWSFQKTLSQTGLYRMGKIEACGWKRKAVLDREIGGNKLCELGGPER